MKNPIQKLLVLNALVVVSVVTTGCDRGRQSATGRLEVRPGQHFILRDRNGTDVEFSSGRVALDYQDRGRTRDTALFVLRTEDNSRGILFELPTTAFTNTADFRVDARTVNQRYDVRCHRDTEHLGTRVYDTTEGCTDLGFCCQVRTRSVSDGQGGTTTEVYTDCGMHADCPGDRDVRMRHDDYVDHFFVDFLNPDDSASAVYRGDGRPYSTETKIANLSGCRT